MLLSPSNPLSVFWVRVDTFLVFQAKTKKHTNENDSLFTESFSSQKKKRKKDRLFLASFAKLNTPQSGLGIRNPESDLAKLEK